MPRMTRAALKAQEFNIAQDSASNSSREQSPSEDTPITTKVDPALGEISGNDLATTSEIGDETMSGGKETATRSKGKRVKKALKGLFSGNEGQKAEEDDQERAEQIANNNESLLSSTQAEDNEFTLNPEEQTSQTMPDSPKQAAAEDQQNESEQPVDFVSSATTPATPTSQGNNAAALSTSVTDTKTPKFEPVVHAEPVSQESESGDIQEDSFVDSIKTRSPTKIDNNSPAEGSPTIEEDSFVNDIHTRSPRKPSPRIEDSVEAIDALEEALEQVAMNLPSMPEEAPESPVKTVKSVPSARKTTPMVKATGSTQKRKVTPVAVKTLKDISSGPKPTVSNNNKVEESRRSTSQPKPRMSIKPTTLSTSKPAFVPTKSAKPPTKSTFMLPGEAVAAKLKAQREERLNREGEQEATEQKKPAFVPTKSTKPPTRSTFMLPGEAVAAKLKAQREERSKREEDKESAAAEQKKPAFKARPAPKFGPAPTMPVRTTATSKARQSLALGGVGDSNTKENDVPGFKKTSSRPSTADTLMIKKRQSALLPTTPQKASSTMRSNSNPSATQSRQRPVSSIFPGRPSHHKLPSKTTVDGLPPRKINRVSSLQSDIDTTKPRVTSGGAPVSKTDIATQRARAREIFNREKLVKEELERVKKEKEDAAKKARAEASERGRIASREWAEKQKKIKKVGGTGAGGGEAVAV